MKRLYETPHPRWGWFCVGLRRGRNYPDGAWRELEIADYRGHRIERLKVAQGYPRAKTVYTALGRSDWKRLRDVFDAIDAKISAELERRRQERERWRDPKAEAQEQAETQASEEAA